MFSKGGRGKKCPNICPRGLWMSPNLDKHIRKWQERTTFILRLLDLKKKNINTKVKTFFVFSTLFDSVNLKVETSDRIYKKPGFAIWREEFYLGLALGGIRSQYFLLHKKYTQLFSRVLHGNFLMKIGNIYIFLGPYNKPLTLLLTQIPTCH